MASLILGVTGKKRSGKDTFASRLVSAHGFTRLAFADPLKDSLRDVNPLIEVGIEESGLVFGQGSIATRPRYLRLQSILADIGWEAAKEVREVRRLLQSHGVAMRDHLNPDLWVDAVHAKADLADGPVVITDVRFPNEADFVSAYGQLVRVTRPGLESTDTHVSETALDGYTAAFNVVNDGTVEDLHAQADAVLRDPLVSYLP